MTPTKYFNQTIIVIADAQQFETFLRQSEYGQNADMYCRFKKAETDEFGRVHLTYEREKEKL